MNAGRVIVIGSVNVDLVMRLPGLPAAGQTVLGGVLARHEGGKGANQAVAAARAGAQVHFIGAVGASDGQQSVDALAAEGIDVSAIERVFGPTGHAFVLVDGGGSGENQIAVAPGANALVTATHVTAALGALAVTPADVLVLSFELPPDALRAAAGVAHSVGGRLVVNPSPVLPRSRELLDGAIMTLNAGELAAITDGSGSSRFEPRTAAAALARSSGAPVIVTLGPRGALLADDDGTWPFPGHRVAVRDTTGAGDTFAGVLASGLAAGRPLRGCVQRAVAASALSVTQDGARPGMPAAAAIDAWLALDPNRPGPVVCPCARVNRYLAMPTATARPSPAPSPAAADPISQFFASLTAPGYIETFAGDSATLRFDAISGGHVQHWYVTISNGNVAVTRENNAADAVIRIERTHLEALVTGRLNAQAAMLRGLFHCEGSMAALMTFQRCLPGPPGSTGRVAPISSQTVMAQRRPI